MSWRPTKEGGGYCGVLATKDIHFGPMAVTSFANKIQKKSHIQFLLNKSLGVEHNNSHICEHVSDNHLPFKIFET